MDGAVGQAVPDDGFVKPDTTGVALLETRMETPGGLILGPIRAGNNGGIDPLSGTA